MSRVWQKFKDFWTAEEVPRWFGFSLVVIYLVGLAGVARFGVDQARSDTTRMVESSVHYLVRDLTERLTFAQRHAESDTEAMFACRGALNRFAAEIPSRWLRIVDAGGRVLASTRAIEIGSVVASDWGPSPPGGFSLETVYDAEKGKEEVRVRAPLDVAPRSAQIAATEVGPNRTSDRGAAGKSASSRYFEGRIRIATTDESVLAGWANALTVILVAFGALFALYRRLRSHLRGAVSIAGRLKRHDPRVEADLTALHIADGTDKITGAWNQLVGLTAELSEALNRHEANDELSRALQHSAGGALAEALHALPDALFHIVDEDRFDYVNAAALRLLGWKIENVKEMSLNDARSNDIGTRILDQVRSALTPSGAFEPKSTTLDTGDDSGNPNFYRLWIVPLLRAQRQGECLVIVRDVSQQRRSECAREEFVAQVTHELRTPLTNIRAYAETLSSGMFDDPKVITECYNVITKETRRLSRLIEDILSVSQLEVGSIQLHIDQVDLRVLLEDGVRDVRGLADEKDIELILALPSKMEPIRADQDKLAVVVNNLLGNAIKYTPKGGTVQIGCQYTGDTALLTFKDNGIGIDAEDQARVFDKFQRGRNDEVKEETGSGIGLYTAREIVRRHNGDIELISKVKEGSTFMVRIPHRESRASALSAAEEV